MERKIETYDSAEEFLKDLEEKRLAGIFNDRSILNIKNTEFNFKIEIPLSSKIGHLSTTLNKYFSSGKQIFSNCIFNEKVTINSSQKEIFFNNNCEFKKQLKVGLKASFQLKLYYFLLFFNLNVGLKKHWPGGSFDRRLLLLVRNWFE